MVGRHFECYVYEMLELVELASTPLCIILFLGIIFINGKGFMGGCTPPLHDFFLFLTSFFKIGKRFFASVIKIISGIYG